MIYTKDTFDPKHIGLRVKGKYWSREEFGILKGFNGFYFDQLCESDGMEHLADSYELLPMPLKEAYDRGLLKVGQKVRTFRKNGSSETTDNIIEIKEDCVITDLDDYCKLYFYNDDEYSWLVEILEEPKEEKEVYKTKGTEEVFSKETFESAMESVSKACSQKGEPLKLPLISYSILTDYINQPTKPMSYLAKVRKAAKDLFTPEDVKIMREAGWESEPHVRTQEGTEALLDMLFEENRPKLIEKAKEIKAEIDKNLEKE